MSQSLGFSKALVGQRRVIKSKKLSHMKQEDENLRKGNDENVKKRTLLQDMVCYAMGWFSGATCDPQKSTW